MLFGITLFVNLIALATTLWGAFYLLARGFRSWITLKAVIVLLLLSVYFFRIYHNLFQSVTNDAAERALLLIFGLGTWYSLTYGLISPQGQDQLRRMNIFIFVLGGMTVALLLVTRGASPAVQGSTLYLAPQRTEPPYLLYAVFRLVISFGILQNLLTGDKVGLTRQGKYFLAASLFPAAAAVSAAVGSALTPRMPRVIPDFLIFCGVLLLGISIARHQTLIERRTTIYDLPISALTVLGLAALYAFLAMGGGWSLDQMGTVIALAVLTHSFYDLVREFLERQRMQHESTFRRQLRNLESQGSGEEALRARLQAGLDLLCQTLDVGGGFIAVRRAADFVVSASNNSIPVGNQLAAALVVGEDSLQIKNDQLPGIEWLAPAFEGAVQVAVIGLHRPKAKLAYSAGDLALLNEVADRVGTIISMGNLTAGRVDQIRRLVAESDARANELSAFADEMLTTIANQPDVEFIKTVEHCLRHFAEFITLGQSPLADWTGIQAGSHVERGKELQKILAESIEYFRPLGKRPTEPLPREWYSYVVLHDAYIEGVPNREIMGRLYISEGTFNRTRRSALRSLARLLMEKHEGARVTAKTAS